MEFAKGVKVREKKFDNGNSVINLSFDIAEFMNNPINDDRWINIKLQRGKESGKLYAVNDEYYQRGE